MDDYRYWLYNHKHENILTLLSSFDMILKKQHNLKLNILVISTTDDIENIIESNIKFKLSVQSKTENIMSAEITRDVIRFEKKITERANFILLKTNFKYVYILITDEPITITKNIIIPFFNNYFPYISRTFFNSSDLQEILINLKRITKKQITTERIVAYKRFLNGNKIKKRNKESSVVYTEKPFETVFEETAENDQWIDKISFNLMDDNKTIFNGYLSRRGLIRCGTNFSTFYQTIINQILKRTSEMKTFYSNRSRNESNNFNVNPITIRFDYDIFKDKNQNQRFITSLNELNCASIAVYHANPYIHLSLVDFLDGSSYDVWALTNNDVVIVPQLRASYASLARVVNHIFESFREGTLGNYCDEK